MPDPVQLAISALADLIRLEVSSLSNRCAKGWPDPSEALVMPCASITHGDPDRTGHEAQEISQSPVEIEVEVVVDEEVQIETQIDPTNVDVAYEVADLVVPVQLDVWGRSRTERGDTAAAIRALFTDPEVGDDLRLTLSNYHGRLATFQIERWRDDDDADAAKQREWRQTIELTLEVPEVVVKRQPLLLTVDAAVEVYNADEVMT